MPHAPINGIDIYYEVHGTGDAIIFCHEFAGDIRSWDLQVNHFSRNFQVITYCARGYSPTSVPEDPKLYTQDLVIDDLKGLMDFLKIDKAHIVGHSLGGMIGPSYARKYPDKVLSLSLLSTAAFRGDDGQKKILNIL
mgnify:CR=1 FL=1